MPGGKGNIRPEDGIPFSSTNQPPENLGRPPKGFRAFAVYCKDKGFESVTEQEVLEAYLLLMQLPAHEVISIAGSPVKEYDKGNTDNQHPAVLRMVASEFFKKRGQEMLRHLENRAFGTPTNKTEHSGSLALTNGGEMSPADFAAIKAIVDKE